MSEAFSRNVNEPNLDVCQRAREDELLGTRLASCFWCLYFVCGIWERGLAEACSKCWGTTATGVNVCHTASLCPVEQVRGLYVVTKWCKILGLQLVVAC